MLKLEILVGPIASGKSTYARQRADEGALIISHDDLTQMLHARYRYEPELRNCYRAMMIQLACNAIVAERDVVVDRTHLTRESRKVWVEFAHGAMVASLAVVFPSESPEVHARRRFDSDARGRDYEEWLAVAKHHHDQLMTEPLDYFGEGFSGRHRINRQWFSVADFESAPSKAEVSSLAEYERLRKGSPLEEQSP